MWTAYFSREVSELGSNKQVKHNLEARRSANLVTAQSHGLCIPYSSHLSSLPQPIC